MPRHSTTTKSEPEKHTTKNTDETGRTGKTRIRQPDQQPESTHAEESQRTCSECGTAGLVAESGELICDACGLVIKDEQIDHGPEWRAFDHTQREQKSRVGAPTTQTLHDRGLTTDIDWRDADASGNQITGQKRTQLNRLRRWHERIRTQDAGERNLRHALSEIDRMASALGLPESIRETASVIYRRSLAEDLLRGRSIEGMATGAVYASCRQQQIARSLDELTAVSRVDYNEIARAYRYLATELGLELQPTSPKEFLPRFVSELDLSHATQTRAEEILEASMDAGIHAGKSPPAFAAAAIYAATLLCGVNCTQREVGAVAHVSEVTIRNRYQEQLDAMDLPTS